MNRRPAITRLFALAALAALSASLLGPAAVQAQDATATGPRTTIPSDPNRTPSPDRSFRHVDLAALPAATGFQAAAPDTRLPAPPSFGPKGPDVQGGGPPLPVESTSNGDPAVTQATAFDGLVMFERPATSLEPPDPWVAAGPDHVMQAVNTTFRITDRSGHPLETVDMFDFFGLSSIPGYDAVVVDPRVIYDSLHGRWIAIEASFDCVPFGESKIGTGYIDIAVSDTADPTAGWGILSISYPDAFPDYPGIGTSTDKVVVSANVFALVPGGDLGCEPASFVGTEMDVMAWSELLGTGNVYIDFLYSPFSFANNFFTWRPALQTPATSATVFAISERFDLGVAYARITGSPAANGVTSIAISDLTGAAVVSPFEEPPQPQQPGPDEIDNAVDERPTDAIWKDNRLAFVSNYPCEPLGGAPETRTCVRISELSTASPAAPTLIQDFLIAQFNRDSYFGGIGYALNDDLHVVWTRSGTNAAGFPTSMGAYQAAGAPINTISGRTVLSPGTDSYVGERWGDYAGVAQDPQVPNAVWAGNQYSIGGWATEITQLQTGGTTFVPIDPIRVLDTRPGITIGLTGTFAHGVARSWAVAGFDGGTIPADAIAVTGNLTVTGQTAGGLCLGHAGAEQQPGELDDQLPAWRHPGQQPDDPGQHRRHGLRRVPRLGRQDGPPDLRRDRLLRGRRRRGRVRDDHPGPGPRQPARHRHRAQRPVPQGRPPRPVDRPGPRPGRGRRDHRQPDRRRADRRRLPVDHAGIRFNPTTSNLNFPLGDTRANGLVAPLDAEDDLWIVYKTTAGGARSANVILDVTGYFVDDPAGMQYFPLTPGRTMDTRNVPLSGSDRLLQHRRPAQARRRRPLGRARRSRARSPAT